MKKEFAPPPQIGAGAGGKTDGVDDEQLDEDEEDEGDDEDIDDEVKLR